MSVETRPPPRVLPYPPKGAFCDHRRMRYRKCREDCPVCEKTGAKGCMVECPCGLSWMFFEDEYG